MEALQHAAQWVADVSYHFQKRTSSEYNLIPDMAWERDLQAALGLSKDQQRFMLALFASVLVGAGIRALRNPTLRHLYALVTGVVLTYYPFGAGVVHALPPAVLTYLGMVVAPRSSGTLAWLANFPYLIYLHVVNASGANWMQGQMDFTGCEMVLVLKLISVAVAYQDHRARKKEDLSVFQAKHAVQTLPNPLEFLSYVFCLGNLLAGPYMEFNDFKDFMELKGVWDAKANASRPAPGLLLPTLTCLGETALFMGVYLRTVVDFNVHTFKQAWYWQAPVYTRMGVIVVAGLTNQLKYCFSWKLSELSLTLAGLNFNGWSDKDGKPQWGRCRNVRFFHLQTCDTARNVTFYWNICTGTFLRRYVYERLVPKGGKPGFRELFVTQMVSAVWHGLYAGYQLFFAGTAIWIYFSTLLYKLELKYAPSASKLLPWHVVKALWTNFVLNYMAMAFMVLDLRGSLDVYRSIYYWPHLVMITGILVMPPLLGGGKKAGAGKDKAQKAE